MTWKSFSATTLRAGPIHESSDAHKLAKMDGCAGMSKTHIIAFIKDPDSEPVKTRLAASIGTDHAKALYCIFLEVLREQLARLASRGFQSTIAHSPVALSASTAALFHGFEFIHQGFLRLCTSV